MLSEAYLKYLIGKTDVKAGRQYMQMPLVAGNYSRAFKESFEGVTISNKNIPKKQKFQAAGFINFKAARATPLPIRSAGRRISKTKSS